MLLLASASDLVRVITSSAAPLDVHASYVDLASSAVTPGRANTAIVSAATTTIVASPAADTFRTVKTLHLRNRHATTAQTVTVLHSDGTNVLELIKVTLPAGYQLHYDEGAGFEVLDAFGRTLQNTSQNGAAAAVNSLNLVVLSADVVNNNATANSIADVTGLSFPVAAGETYWFRFAIDFAAAATTTGSRWAINGPAVSRLSYASNYALTTGSESINNGLTAYDLPAAANASSAATAGNTATIEGFITPSANGAVIARFASEVASSAITARAGSLLQWIRVL